MPPMPKIGNVYTRDQIHSMLGGAVQAFLPTKNGRVVCGCFKLEANPDAPEEVLVGIGPQREASARTSVLQQTPIPIFLKGVEGEWLYVGKYQATRYLNRDHDLLVKEERAKRADVAGILYMKKAEEPAVAS
jgi:hypothetical protein